ncbi:MAG: NrpR regulatory domain-containing protein [Desulfobacterota bacterium]|jgi:HTH-type transcriptional regulator, global nitrogen regulator NrpRI|nr:NrpR regulatory domain-containing protein [Thermodesulfobacteriota bacterium]
MQEKRKRIRQVILNVLKEAGRPLSSLKINEDLLERGHDISERTVRLYLQSMEEEGLTEKANRRCHRITAQGVQEAESSQIIERVGFLSARIDQMTYQMDFDLASCSGTVVINITNTEPRHVMENIDLMNRVYKEGYAMGTLITVLGPGEKVGHITIPDNMVGIGTVCSITLNGVLLKAGIPTNSRFGGLLEIADKKPTRFVEIIMYEGTSLDPLEVFIRSGMTNYLGAVKTGNGRIGASFREFPGASRDMVADLAQQLDGIGLGGFMRIGRPGQTLLEIPVGEGRFGAIVIGGLNPVAIMEENGVRVHSRALAGLIDFKRLFHYSELEGQLKPYL